MIEVTPDIGDNRRCSFTIWKNEGWEILAFVPGLPNPSRVQDYMQAGKVIGQTYYFKIDELPVLVEWLENSGRTYRFKAFNEKIAPSASVLRARSHAQEQLAKLNPKNTTVPEQNDPQ